MHRTRSRGKRPSGSRFAPVLGIDGEGLGREPHRYVYLAASDSTGRLVYEVRDAHRLSTVDCFEFLLNEVPRDAQVFGYSFRYDVTKIIEDLPDELIGELMHESLRYYRTSDGRDVYRPVKWRGYSINWFNGKFTLKRVKEKRRITIWDVFAFYQSKFLKALKDWKVGTAAEHALIERMKNARGELEKMTREETEDYCKLECRLLASLVERLIEAHEDVAARLCADGYTDEPFKMKSWYGAGSTGGALLKALDAGSYIRKPRPGSDLWLAIASAFAGGRFENSQIGIVKKRVRARDISSAYPYQIAFLPCLKCGEWKRVNPSDVARYEVALVHWRMPPVADLDSLAWAPFPFRDRDGSVCFPVNAEGWVWGKEWLAGLALFPELDAVEAWAYEVGCEHRPFACFPALYELRIQLGKDGPGIILKLGYNAGYGKMAQSRGTKPPFASWVWAGIITSNTRAQLLGALGAASDPWNVLSFATDGVLTTEELALPEPRDTGTGECRGPDGETVRKPLGGWEEKDSYRNGVFLVRPGIYGPLDPTEKQLDDCRARGIGRKAYFDNWKKIVSAFEAWDRVDPDYTVKIAELVRFHGAKSSLTFAPKRDEWTRSKHYGDWTEEPVELSFNPMPKRSRVMGKQRLRVRDLGGRLSRPYAPALGRVPVQSDEAEKLRAYMAMLLEQPDADLTEGYDASPE